jgi:two-component system sensor histidine kinase DesK
MKWLKLPSEDGKPMWGGLFWAVPFLYVYLDPYQRHADWLEWTLTTFGLVLVLGLYTLGLVYWSHKDIVRKVCIATTFLTVVFMAYRPTFAIYFPLVAAFVPFAVGGNIPRSVAFIGIVVGIFIGEAWLLGGKQYTTLTTVIAIESILIGAGTTFAARQQIAVTRANKVAERERIARDLHDILGHTLSVIVLKSELAGKLIEQDPERARREIAEVEKVSRKALAEVREAIHGYHAGDMQAEFERAEVMLKSAGVIVHLGYDKVAIPAAQERIMILALKEAVTNILRHAQAKQCRIQLQQIDGAYRLEVSDDGHGGVSESGLGLRGMRQRVEAIGGRMTWSSDSGTQLSVTLPVAQS